MLAAGVDIQIREEWCEQAPAKESLDIAVAAGIETFAFNLTDTRAGYVISVRLVGRARGGNIGLPLDDRVGRRHRTREGV